MNNTRLMICAQLLQTFRAKVYFAFMKLKNIRTCYLHSIVFPSRIHHYPIIFPVNLKLQHGDYNFVFKKKSFEKNRHSSPVTL